MDLFKVIFRESFLNDLETILKSVACYHPEAARRLGEIIVQRSESLSFFPERFPRVRQRPGIRRFIVSRYFKVFYRVREKDKSVEVLRCWDGRQNLDPKF